MKEEYETSFQFLSVLDADEPVLNERGVAYLGPNTGFLPPVHLPPLPPPHDLWFNAAKSLPETAKSWTWSEFISKLPALSADDIRDEHLVRAHLYLGLIANAIVRVAGMNLPDTISKPWTQIAKKLGQLVPSLTYNEMILFNFEAIPHRFVFSGHLNSATGTERFSHSLVSSPWTELKPHMMLFNCMTEEHFQLSVIAIEFAARPLPGIIAACQQGVVRQDVEDIRENLLKLIRVIEDMGSAITSSDLRSHSKSFLDQVEFSRTAGILASPLLPNGKGTAGSLSPSLHLLDAFFLRRNYESKLGNLMKEEYAWLPKLHRDFIESVRQVSVLKFIQSLHDTSTALELMTLYQRACIAFAGEEGFLGKHRIRAYGLLEIGMKIGRDSTSAGSGASSWKVRPWYRINESFLESNLERLSLFKSNYSPATVVSCGVVDGHEGAKRLFLNVEGCLKYSPGDHIAVLPENSQSEILQALSAFGVEGSQQIILKNPLWIQALRDRRFPLAVPEGEKTSSTRINAFDFFRYAGLHLMNEKDKSRLVESMYCINYSIISYIHRQQWISVPQVINLLARTTFISAKSLMKDIDMLLHPIPARLYSICSNASYSPGIVEIIVGRVQHAIPSKILVTSNDLRNRYMHSSKAEDSFQKLHSHSTLWRDLAKKEWITRDDEKEDGVQKGNCPSGLRYDSKSLRRVCDILSSKKTAGKLVGYHALRKAQMIVASNSSKTDIPKSAEGIGSSFLWRLEVGDGVQTQIIPDLEFRIPKDPDVPLVMIGLGTGVAPFRSFMKQLILQKQKSEHMHCLQRDAWLILGVRSADTVPFLDEIQEAVCRHKVMKVSIAVSREDVELDEERSQDRLVFKAGKRKRIQGLFEEDASISLKLWKMISGRGHIFVCGMPELDTLARELIGISVQRHLPSIWSTTVHDLNSNLMVISEEFVQRLISDRRYHVNCFYGKSNKTELEQVEYLEIAEHCIEHSCWTIFRGVVYDITKYLYVHPGGVKLLLDKGGRDMTKDFEVAHGEGNARVASMLEPYKIAMIRSWRHGSSRLIRFMKSWSLPLLHDALEHRSVFLLDYNHFPDVAVPPSFLKWQSPWGMGKGLQVLCSNFWGRHEASLFSMLSMSLSQHGMGLALNNLQEGVGDRINFDAVKGDMFKCRETSVNKASKTVREYTENETEQFITSCKHFMDGVVSVCRDVQRKVEISIECSHYGYPVDDMVQSLIASVLVTMNEGLPPAYALLPKDAPMDGTK